jgi:3-oxoacyl-[acyl-carrier protein] reductase
MQRTAGELEALGRRVLQIECDMSDSEQIRAMYQQVDREYGRIDILGNVAGNARGGNPLEVSEADVEFTMKNLIVGRLVSCQEAARRMIAAGKGSIINLISIAGITALGRNHLPYSMGMAGAAQMTRELSTEWSARGCGSTASSAPRS